MYKKTGQNSWWEYIRIYFDIILTLFWQFILTAEFILTFFFVNFDYQLFVFILNWLLLHAFSDNQMAMFLGILWEKKKTKKSKTKNKKNTNLPLQVSINSEALEAPNSKTGYQPRKQWSLKMITKLLRFLGLTLGLTVVLINFISVTNCNKHTNKPKMTDLTSPLFEKGQFFSYSSPLDFVGTEHLTFTGQHHNSNKLV